MARDVIIRTYSEADFRALLELKNISAGLSPDGSHLSAAGLKAALQRPRYSPQESLFVAEEQGRVVGFLDITAEPEIGRAVVECLVRPRYRRRGIAHALFARAEAYIRAAGCRAIHVHVKRRHRTARKALERCGFNEVRRTYEMAASALYSNTGAPPGRVEGQPEWIIIEQERREQSTGAPPGRVEIRPLQPGEEASLTGLQNRAFQGAWGFQPNTLEEIRYAIRSREQDIRLAICGGKPVGYCWCQVQRSGRGEAWGRIRMLGVAPGYRGQGLGQELLRAALGQISSRGLSMARLTVDSRNAPALALYRSLGFRRKDTGIWYEKRLG